MNYLYKFVNSIYFWPVVIVIAIGLVALDATKTVYGSSQGNLEYSYKAAELASRDIYEFKTHTGTVCVMARNSHGSQALALSCDFTGNSHAK